MESRSSRGTKLLSINCFTFLNILNISDCSDFLVSSDLSTVPQLRWLHILRVLSLYNLTQNVVRNGNVDNEDELKVLVGYNRNRCVHHPSLWLCRLGQSHRVDGPTTMVLSPIRPCPRFFGAKPCLRLWKHVLGCHLVVSLVKTCSGVAVGLWRNV